MPRKKVEPTEGEVVEEKTSQETPKHTEVHINYQRGWGVRVWLGIILVLLGALTLIQEVYDINIWSYFWPVFLIIIGAALLLNASRR
jgi:uncharacterized membrane protein HdeD (DUF308 family)